MATNNDGNLLIDKLKVLFEDPEKEAQIANLSLENIIYQETSGNSESLKDILGLAEWFSIDNSKSILEQIHELYGIIAETGGCFWKEIKDEEEK